MIKCVIDMLLSARHINAQPYPIQSIHTQFIDWIFKPHHFPTQTNTYVQIVINIYGYTTYMFNIKRVYHNELNELNFNGRNYRSQK